ncbi:uncharacterized protein ACN2A1_012495 isoform 2-T2 [Glossina fuscipes fuscipes]
MHKFALEESKQNFTTPIPAIVQCCQIITENFSQSIRNWNNNTSNTTKKSSQDDPNDYKHLHNCKNKKRITSSRGGKYEVVTILTSF